MSRISLMNPQQAKQLIADLTKSINEHNRAYYINNQPTVSDGEYDALLAELIDLEAQFPQLVKADSPSQRVGAKVEGNLPTIKHQLPMLSLDNTYNVDELRQWYQRLTKSLGLKSIDLTAELKIDGVSAAIVYANGVLRYGATRGDGVVGEDVTHNIKTMQTVPLVLHADVPADLEVRGEVYMSKNDFDALNKRRVANQEDVFVNPRNAASGALKLLDAKESAKRGLRFFVHSFGDLTKGVNLDTQQSFLTQCAKWGFAVNPMTRLCHGIDEVTVFCEEMLTKRSSLAYDVDGVVIKVNRFDYQQQLGFTQKSPRWAVAFKFPAYQATTNIESIDVQVGRTGVLTPVANLTPVFCGGVTISRATLHNFDEIKRLNVNVSDKVLIERAGDVIPKIVKVTEKNSTNAFQVPNGCPVCQSEIVHDEGAVAYRCINPKCPKQVERLLIHFASRAAMDIQGLGEAVVVQLLSRNMVNDVADFYALTRDDLCTLELFATKKAENLINAIEASKQQPLSKLLLALGVENIGSKAAMSLAKHFGDIDQLMNADEAALTAIDDIGPITAKAVVAYFHNDQVKRLIAKLKQVGVNMVEKAIAQGDKLAGKSFVFTGELDGLSREEAGEMVMRQGGKVVSSVSAKTDFVVVGVNPGSKYQKALQLGVTTLNQEQFLSLVQQ